MEICHSVYKKVRICSRIDKVNPIRQKSYQNLTDITIFMKKK